MASRSCCAAMLGALLLISVRRAAGLECDWSPKPNSPPNTNPVSIAAGGVGVHVRDVKSPGGGTAYVAAAAPSAAQRAHLPPSTHRLTWSLRVAVRHPPCLRSLWSAGEGDDAMHVLHLAGPSAYEVGRAYGTPAREPPVHAALPPARPPHPRGPAPRRPQAWRWRRRSRR